ncbi:MAG: response regulator, partial [Planctomycetota bacterium]
AVEADVTQIRQVVMNLITNASEAIGETSGVIAVATGARQCDRAHLDQTYLAEDLPEGLYVTLEVADTGSGMDVETRAKIFDPFYSTKFAGRGLGLAALLGIVRGHRGAVRVDSEVGRGTTFTVLLPASPLPAAGRRPGEPAATAWRGSGTVLLTDDEETVRAVGRQMLETIGFDVITANDGREAVETYRMHPGRIDCVILDLTMPHMDGEAALRQLRRIDPRARVILSSGYDEQEVTARFGDQGLAGFIQKPYQLEDLAARMKQALGRGVQPAPGASDPLGPDNE